MTIPVNQRTLPPSNVRDDVLKIPGFDDNDSGAKVADPGAANAGGGGFLDIPAAPGFGDDESGKVSSGGGGGGFLDIPAAPGFDDDERKAVSGGAGGFQTYPRPQVSGRWGLRTYPRPRDSRTLGLPDIPAAPGFEDAGGFRTYPRPWIRRRCDRTDAGTDEESERNGGAEG